LRKFAACPASSAEQAARQADAYQRGSSGSRVKAAIRDTDIGFDAARVPGKLTAFGTSPGSECGGH